MYRLKKHLSAATLRKKWENMVTFSVYQSFFVQKQLSRSMPVYSALNRYIPVFCEVIENKETLMIFPLCKYIGSNRYCIMGKLNGFQLYDIVYKVGLPQEKIDDMVSFVLQSLSMDSLEVAYLPEDSALYRSIMNLQARNICHIETEAFDNVMISADDGYEQYAASLSKHTRQNLRTAYNRIGSAGLDVRLEVVSGKPLSRVRLKEIMDLYCERHEIRYGVQTPAIKKWYLNHLDFSTKCIQNAPQNFYAILYLGETVAAFMGGIIDTDRNCIIIPRLSISNDFLRYSPGMVLINETMKYMIAAIGVARLDLSKGAEQYKFAMGGLRYPTYTMKLSSINCSDIQKGKPC